MRYLVIIQLVLIKDSIKSQYKQFACINEGSADIGLVNERRRSGIKLEQKYWDQINRLFTLKLLI